MAGHGMTGWVRFWGLGEPESDSIQIDDLTCLELRGTRLLVGCAEAVVCVYDRV